MKKIAFTISLLLALVGLSPALALARDATPAPEASPAPEAQGAPEASPIPERDGVYDDPDHVGVKVRVFVHHEKRARAALAPSLVCGLADPDSSAVTPAAGWHLSSTWTYNLNPSSAPSSVKSDLPTIASNAFGTWQAAVGGKVTFSRGSDTFVSKSAYDGKNVVAFNKLSPSYLGVTYIRYFVATGQVVDVDTILNKRYSWSWSNSSTCAYAGVFDVADILTHETGHWMGLDDTYDAAYVDNTMYGYGATGEVKKVTLTSGDTVGVNAIYP